eukprot:2056996-Pyramimonas_sp.AAC.1
MLAPIERVLASGSMCLTTSLYHTYTLFVLPISILICPSYHTCESASSLSRLGGRGGYPARELYMAILLRIVTHLVQDQAIIKM